MGAHWLLVRINPSTLESLAMFGLPPFTPLAVAMFELPLMTLSYRSPIKFLFVEMCINLLGMATEAALIPLVGWLTEFDTEISFCLQVWSVFYQQGGFMNTLVLKRDSKIIAIFFQSSSHCTQIILISPIARWNPHNTFHVFSGSNKNIED